MLITTEEDMKWVAHLKGLLPVDIPTRDNVPWNEQRALDQSGDKNM